MQKRMPTTAGSRILANSFPVNNSWIAEKLVKSNAIIIGKLIYQSGQITELPFPQVVGVQ